VPIGIFLQPGANALEVGAATEARMKELSQRFPAGLEYSSPTTPRPTSRCRSARCW
jgi:multidrug efflux pump subunit AcrB